MSDIRGIHYELSKPTFNETDGYYYQRRRQVDGQGNLVGIGEERIQLPKPNSLDGQYQRDLDWSKLGKLGGDVGQIGIGALKRDPRMITNGAVSFGKDVQNGVFRDYDSWPGTDKPWENGDIPAPSRDFTVPDDGSKEPASPHSQNFPIGRLVRLTSTSASDNGSSGSLNAAPGNPAMPAPPSASEGPIGLVSGQPMRFPFAAIFDTRPPSGTNGDPSRRSALDDMIWNGLGSRASSRGADVDAAPPLVPDRRISSGNAHGPAPSAGGQDAALTVPARPDSQGPLSLNDAYLEYLRRLNAS